MPNPKPATESAVSLDEILDALGECEYAVRRFTHEDSEESWAALTTAADRAEAILRKARP